MSRLIQRDMTGCHVRMSGAMIVAPMASPSHQNHQIEGNLVHEAEPTRQSETTPIDALTHGASTAPKTINASTSRTRLRLVSKFLIWRARKAPSSASKVFPMEIPTALIKAGAAPCGNAL